MSFYPVLLSQTGFSYNISTLDFFNLNNNNIVLVGVKISTLLNGKGIVCYTFRKIIRNGFFWTFSGLITLNSSTVIDSIEKKNQLRIDHRVQI